MTCFEEKQSKQHQDIYCTLWFMHMNALVRVRVGGRAQTEKNALLGVTSDVQVSYTNLDIYLS
jgi:hypothetical protein